MDKHELLIWAAGFFDGEGCISISCSRKGKRVAHPGYYTLQLTAFQNTRVPLDVFLQLFGGAIRYSTTHSTGGWIWAQTGPGTIETLFKMTPYLLVKRAQAEVAITFQRRKAPKGGKYDDPVAARALDDIDFQEVRRLKVIGG